MVRAGSRALWALTTAVAFLALSASAQAVAAPTAPPTHGAGSSAARHVSASDDWITNEADFLSARTLAVTCSSSSADWAQVLGDAGLPSAEASQFYGFSVIAAGAMHLSPYVCQGLRLGVDPLTRAANVLQVGWAVDVLVHESVHMGRWTADEALAEACARAGLPGELHRLYGIAYRSAEMSALTLAATWFRRTQSASYQGGVCTPA